jgi:hypothetical protein
MKKTWKLINELNSRTVRKLKNFGNYFGDQVVTSPVEMAETFNSYFSNTAPHRTAPQRTAPHLISQKFATKLCNFTPFKTLFPDMVMDFVLLV